jgi:hypothetical protein
MDLLGILLNLDRDLKNSIDHGADFQGLDLHRGKEKVSSIGMDMRPVDHAKLTLLEAVRSYIREEAISRGFTLDEGF